ncbi:MAG: hypothetical protein WA891_20680 [Acidobacteriaceae bacterium]
MSDAGSAIWGFAIRVSEGCGRVTGTMEAAKPMRLERALGEVGRMQKRPAG